MEERHDWLPFLVSFIIILIVAAGFTVLYFRVTSSINDNNNAISQLNSQLNTQLATLQSRLAAEDSTIASLTGQISDLLISMASDSANLSSLSTNLDSVQSRASGISQQLNSLNANVSDLRGQNSASATQFITLQNQLTALQGQLSSAQGTISALQSQVTTQQATLASIAQQAVTTTTLFTSQSISEPADSFTFVDTFVPPFTGTLTISGASNSSTAYILIVDNSNGDTNSYGFSTGTTLNVTLTGGDTYTIYFGNHDASGTITAALTGTFR